MPKGSDLTLETLEAGDAVIGAQSATTHANYAEAYFGDSDLRRYGTPEEYKLDLASGRIDAAIDDVVVLSDWLASEDGACCEILTTLTPDPVINGPGRGNRDPRGRGRAPRGVQRGDRDDPRQRSLPGDQRQVVRVRRLRRLTR